ncbi:hypothetical protein RR45_GL000528 [Lactococcus chungangensis CAU 28 = DSM 22330]|uniref:Uncharacterized protein n=1 Tax=Pseudolactococcus chungangensis CAU 28 = DSM 22330 TaxID=1122154 RepID=A0ABX4I5Z3_9LACT|nr:hypothetical protein RR45_GL000528 [Lactococcus chungangensis CAU 28 = DSM 22330]
MISWTLLKKSDLPLLENFIYRVDIALNCAGASFIAMSSIRKI